MVQRIVDNMKWVMLVSGLLTCTVAYAVVAPQAALESMFGASLEGPMAEVIVRNWGALVTMIGILLIVGAFSQKDRTLILIIAVVSKAFFIFLLLANGFGQQALASILVDLVAIGLFVTYLLQIRNDLTMK